MSFEHGVIPAPPSQDLNVDRSGSALVKLAVAQVRRRDRHREQRRSLREKAERWLAGAALGLVFLGVSQPLVFALLFVSMIPSALASIRLRWIDYRYEREEEKAEAIARRLDIESGSAE